MVDFAEEVTGSAVNVRWFEDAFEGAEQWLDVVVERRVHSVFDAPEIAVRVESR